MSILDNIEKRKTNILTVCDTEDEADIIFYPTVAPINYLGKDNGLVYMFIEIKSLYDPLEIAEWVNCYIKSIPYIENVSKIVIVSTSKLMLCYNDDYKNLIDGNINDDDADVDIIIISFQMFNITNYYSLFRFFKCLRNCGPNAFDYASNPKLMFCQEMLNVSVDIDDFRHFFNSKTYVNIRKKKIMKIVNILKLKSNFSENMLQQLTYEKCWRHKQK